MAIPDFQTIMAPLLRQFGDGEARRIQSCIEVLATQFHLTSEERSEMLPSGRQEKFTNRVHWAAHYLFRFGLVERPSRGALRVTERGRNALMTGPDRITTSWLRQQFGDEEELTRPEPVAAVAPDDEVMVATPDEALEQSYQQLRGILATELLARIKLNSPKFFEQLVVDLLVAMGYGGSLADAGQAIGKSGDDGIDGIIKEDKLGLDVIYLQAKRWDATISRPAVQAFAGSLQGHRARKGVFITTSSFTRDARDFVDRLSTSIVLIDGQELAQLMIDYGVGVSTVATYEVKRVDSEYFEG